MINNVSPHSYHSLPGSRRLRTPPQVPLRSSCSSLPSFLRLPSYRHHIGRDDHDDENEDDEDEDEDGDGSFENW